MTLDDIAAAIDEEERVGTIYIDRAGDKITFQRWREARQDPDYYSIREFDNGQVYANVMWLGEVRDAESKMPDQYPVYGLTFCTYERGNNADPAIAPRRIRDPERSATYAELVEALEDYEDLLVRYAGCKWVPSANKQGSAAGSPDFHFVEVNNRLAPLSKDVPVAAAGIDESIIGSW